MFTEEITVIPEVSDTLRQDLKTLDTVEESTQIKKSLVTDTSCKL